MKTKRKRNMTVEHLICPYLIYVTVLEFRAVSTTGLPSGASFPPPFPYPNGKIIQEGSLHVSGKLPATPPLTQHFALSDNRVKNVGPTLSRVYTCSVQQRVPLQSTVQSNVGSNPPSPRDAGQQGNL